jgi:hypothetical protein
VAKNKKVMHVETNANVEEILETTKDVERVFDELGETPFEPLKE